MHPGYQLCFKKKNYLIKQKKTKLLKLSNTQFDFFIDGNILDKKGKKPILKKLFAGIKSYNEIKSFLKNYRGAFSLIGVSKNCKDIIIARDFDGSNPLYYKSSKNSLLISNRPKKIFESNKILNNEFCNKYINCRYNFIYGSKETFIKKINFLEACTIIHFKNFKKFKKEIFDNRPLKTHHYNISYNQYKSEIPNVLTNSFFKFRLLILSFKIYLFKSKNHKLVSKL